jgi:hypothetical protein
MLWSMSRRLIGVGALFSLCSSACGPTWPHDVVNASDPGLEMRNPSAIDVLPMDLELWTAKTSHANPDAVRRDAEARIRATAVSALGDRGYGIDSMIDWDGQAAGAPMLSQPALLATMTSLATYGDTANRSPGRLPVPYLPARLGTADATLYVGGWAYLGDHHTSTGARIAKDIGIGLLTGVVVVAVVALVVASHGAGAGGFGSCCGGGGDVDHRGSAGPGAGPVGRAVHGSWIGDGGPVVAVRGVDAFGRAGELLTGHPDWAAEPGAPHTGASLMYLEMTLIDNRDGLVLWHAHQVFPANADSDDEVQRAARKLLASLPRH